MDRLQKALDLARAERERNVPVLAAAADSVAANGQDTAALFRTRTVAIDPVLLRKNGVIPADASGAAGQAFKMLRTRVLQKMRQRGWNTLAIVSAIPKDGKTFTAINLAIAIAAQTEHTSLLVDLDLLNPSVHRRFGIAPEVGVEQCLRGQAAVSAALVNPQGYPKLRLLPAIKPTTGSSAALERARAAYRS